MPAGPQGQSLNTDSQNVKTSASWWSLILEWIMPIRFWFRDSNDSTGAAEASGSKDANGWGILHVGNLFAWAYEAIFGTIKTTIFRRESVTIQTHNAVSIGASNNSPGAWFDCGNATEIGVTLKNDAATSSSVDLEWSHDGSTAAGKDFNAIPAGTPTLRASSGRIPTKAKWCRVIAINGDAAAHTMSTWAYLVP